MKISILLTLLLQFLGFVLLSQDIQPRVLNATQVDKPPVLDGMLNDSCWLEANVARDFTAFTMIPGHPMPLPTEVKLIYTNEAVYVGFWNYDSAPDSIMKQLTGRDSDGMSDWCGINFSCYADGVNGLIFAVSPLGEQWDGKVTGNAEADISWNAVWNCKTSTDSKGWYAEFKIPFAALRFPAASEQVWNINFMREIKRYRIIGSWNPIDPLGGSELVQMGKVKNITNVKPPKRFFLFPYASSYNYLGKQSNSFAYNGGLDVKWGLNDAFTLDATLIPDFGQTISDQLILNLTPFEVQFQDNRPFFMEGTELFNKGGIFYSRRIGGAPMGQFELYQHLDSTQSVISNPSQAQLLNSIKISGRNKYNTGVGVLNSLVAPTYASVQKDNGEVSQVLTQPLTNYNTLVVDQNFNQNSYVALTNTNVTREGSIYDANVTAYELAVKDKNNAYALVSSGAYSMKKGTGLWDQKLDDVPGYSQGLRLRKIKGNFNAIVGYYLESDHYDPNDMGFLQANNSWVNYASLSYNLFRPKGRVSKLWSNLNCSREALFAPRLFTNLLVDGEVGVNSRNYTTFNLNFACQPIQGHDYFEPRIWGQQVMTYRFFNLGAWISTDYRKRVAVDYGTSYGRYENQGRYKLNFRVSPRFRLNDHWMFIGVYSLQQHFNDIGFATFNDSNASIPIYGKRDAISHTSVVTISYAINARMSANCRFRHYWGFSRYKLFYEADEGGKLTHTEFDGWSNGQSDSFVNRNFNSLTVDAFFRWIFTPGSECVIGYKTARIQEDNSVPIGLYNDWTTVSSIPKTGSVSCRIIYFLDYRMLKKNKGEALTKF